MAAGQRKDPYKNYRFLLEFDGIIQAGFSEATGLNITSDPIEYREGDEPPSVRKLPGLIKHGNITLKSGISHSEALFTWRKQVEDGKIQQARKNVVVVLVDEKGAPWAGWNFTAAWPVKMEAPSFNATGNEVAIETIEIAHEGFELR